MGLGNRCKVGKIDRFAVKKKDKIQKAKKFQIIINELIMKFNSQACQILMQ